MKDIEKAVGGVLKTVRKLDTRTEGRNGHARIGRTTTIRPTQAEMDTEGILFQTENII